MYLLRLDDASEHWNRTNWLRIHDLLSKYQIAPIVAIIPHNEDPKLLNYPADELFWSIMHDWIFEGWTPALHGYNHVLSSSTGGLNPVNQRSEFAGVSLDKQKLKIRNGLQILRAHNIEPQIFVAPAHTYDLNTLDAIRAETEIRIISDTVANDCYFEKGFFFIPQQSGQVRNIPLKTVTFCYHPNTMNDRQFIELERFLLKHSNNFVSLDKIELSQRKRSIYDRLLSQIYFFKRQFLSK